MDNTQRLYRSSKDHMLAGVCGGIAEYLNVDPTLVRVAFVVLALLSAGTGVMIYGALWLIVPDEPSEKHKRKRKNEEVEASPSVVRSSIPVDAGEFQPEPPSNVAPPTN